MTLEQIITLGNMGFSKAEIMALVKPEAAAPAADPAPAPAPEPVPAPAPAPAPAADSAIAAALENLNAQVAKLQQINIQNSNIPQTTESVDDILARIINPKE